MVAGAVTLTDALMASGKLAQDATVMYVSSEALRAVPLFGIVYHPQPGNHYIQMILGN